MAHSENSRVILILFFIRRIHTGARYDFHVYANNQIADYDYNDDEYDAYQIKFNTWTNCEKWN